MPAPSADIVIVGGGPAGITTALALARAAPECASRVVVLEKGTYPRDKTCAGALGARGDRILSRLDAVPDVPSVPIDGISFRGVGAGAMAAPGAIGRVVRRREFDDALAQIARSRGIDVRDGVRVDAVIPGASAGGAVVETSSGPLRARVVVGADGVGSVVRRAMGLGAGRLRAQALEVDTPAVPGDRDRRLLHFDFADLGLAGYTWDFPTLVDGVPLVCRGIYRLKMVDEARTEAAEPDIQELLSTRLAAMGLDLSRCKNRRFAERGLDPVERLAAGPLMLVGEAAGIDAATGEGIAQAIELGDLAGRFLARTRDVEAWSREVARSRVALDLGVRRAVAPLYYRSGRVRIDRTLLADPDFLHVGCQHFGGQTYDRVRLARVAARAGALLATRALARAFA